MVDPRAIDTVLQLYPPHLAAGRRAPTPVQGGFSGALIYRIATTHGSYCLRRWPDDALPPERIAGLHRLLRFIADHRVTQVAVPVATNEGTTLPRVDGFLWQVEPWMPGNADFRANPSPARLRAAMRCLAQWHTAAAQFEPVGVERTWFARRAAAASPAVTERVALLNGWSAEKRDRAAAALRRITSGEAAEPLRRILRGFEELAPLIASQLRTAATLRFDLHPCLRDVWHDHLLFTGDELTGLIDPSACRTENVAADLARLLGSLIGDDGPLWETALEEYQRHRPLSSDEIGLVVTLDRSGTVLSGLTWLELLVLNEQPVSSAILERLRQIGRRLDRLTSS